MKTYSILKAATLQLSIILTLAFNIAAPSAHALGKEGGGGGNICQPAQNKAILLDLDQPGFKLSEALNEPEGTRIQLHRLEQKMGFASVNLMNNDSLRQAVLARLGRISPHLQEFKAMIYNALFNDVMFIGVNKRFSRAVGADFSSSQLCSEQNTSAVFVYMASILFVSIPTWNSLSLETQADLLIHEGVRHMQKFLGVAFTNKELQDLTSTLLTKPNAEIIDMAFVVERLAAYKGVAEFQSQYCEFASALSQYPKQISKEVVEMFSRACQNPLLSEGVSGKFWKIGSDISGDYRNPDELQELVRTVLQFNAMVELRLAAKNFSNGTSRIVTPMVQFVMTLGNGVLKECVAKNSIEGCQKTIDAYQQILDIGMIW